MGSLGQFVVQSQWIRAAMSALILLGMAAGARAAKPNFIYINCDDLGYGDIEPFGSKRIRTPNINRFAAEGIKFTDYHVTSGVCTPSRSSLMTGCYPKRVGMHTNEKGQWVLFPGNARGLNSSEITIAEILKSQGYTTEIVGKWHLGDQPEFFPIRQGFDEWYGIPFSNDMGQVTDKGRVRLKSPPTPFMRNDKVIEAEPDQTQLTRRYTAESIQFIEKNRDKPFFLYLAHAMPHWPQYASADFAGKTVNRYCDSVEEIDWSTGQIMAALQRLGLEESTLVIFSSDNGGLPGQGGNNGPLRGQKGTTWEGGFRVPMLARWPGKIPAGKACDELSSTLDILPTFAKLAGGELPTDRVIDGRDMWPLLSGEPGAKSPHDSYCYYQIGQLQAVRSGDWKLILPRTEGQNNNIRKIPLQLYNLREDIGESKNRVAQNPAIVEQLKQLAERTIEDLGDDSLKREGKNVRAPGMAKNPKTLTVRPENSDATEVKKKQ